MTQRNARTRGWHRSRRVAVTALFVALGVLVFATSAAAAAPFSLGLNYGLGDFGAEKKIPFIEPAKPASLTGEIEGSTFSVPAAGAVFQPIHITKPLPANLSMTVNAPVTGTFDATTGALAMAANVTFGLESELTGTCSIGPVSLNFSTSGSVPYEAVPFTGGLSGEGAIVTSWQSLPTPTGGPGCAIAAVLTSAPGGLWLAHNIAEPGAQKKTVTGGGAGTTETAPASLKMAVTPSSRTVASGGKARFTVKVSNIGGAASQAVKICVSVPKAVKAGGCQTIASIPAGGIVTRVFSAKAKGGQKSKTYSLKFRAESSGLTSLGKAVKLRVKAAATRASPSRSG